MKKSKLSIPLMLILTILLVSISCTRENRNAESETLKIGIVVPLSGNGTVIGENSMQGAEMAIQEINEAGGLMGKELIIDLQDSKSEPKEGVNIIKRMVSNDQKPFMVYSIVSGVTMAMRPDTEAHEILLVSAVGTDKFIPNSSFTVRNYISASSVGRVIVPYIQDSLGLGSVSIFYANNEYSTSIKNAMVKFADSLSLPVQFAEPFNEARYDYKSLIAGSINDQTDCIFIDGVGTGLGTMIKQIRESGYEGIIVSTPLVKEPDVVTAAGDAITGVNFMDFRYDENSSDPKIQGFVQKYEEKYGSIPSNFAVISYEGVKLILNKINEINSLDNDEILTALNEVRGLEGIFGDISIYDREFEYSFKINRFN